MGAPNSTGWASLFETLSKLLGISEMKLKELRIIGITFREVYIYNTIKLNNQNKLVKDSAIVVTASKTKSVIANNKMVYANALLVNTNLWMRIFKLKW